MIEIGVVNEPSAGFTAPNAKRLEDMGFDYLLTPDTQNLSADPYGQLSLAAAACPRRARLRTVSMLLCLGCICVHACMHACIHMYSLFRALSLRKEVRARRAALIAGLHPHVFKHRCLQ